jgi:hypothetical protein
MMTFEKSAVKISKNTGTGHPSFPLQLIYGLSKKLRINGLYPWNSYFLASNLTVS